MSSLFSDLRAGKMWYPGQSVDSDVVGVRPSLWAVAGSWLWLSLPLGTGKPWALKKTWTFKIFIFFIIIIISLLLIPRTLV